MSVQELIERTRRAAVLAEQDARRAMAEGDVLTAADRTEAAQEHRAMVDYLSRPSYQHGGRLPARPPPNSVGARKAEDQYQPHKQSDCIDSIEQIK